MMDMKILIRERIAKIEAERDDARNKIAALESELSTYKAAAVVGGDGEPIWVGKEVFTKSNGFEYAGKIESIFEAVNGEITATIFIDQGKTPTYYKRMSKEVYNFYSTSEAVPETLSRKETKQ